MGQPNILEMKILASQFLNPGKYPASLIGERLLAKHWKWNFMMRWTEVSAETITLRFYSRLLFWIMGFLCQVVCLSHWLK